MFKIGLNLVFLYQINFTIFLKRNIKIKNEYLKKKSFKAIVKIKKAEQSNKK